MGQETWLLTISCGSYQNLKMPVTIARHSRHVAWMLNWFAVLMFGIVSHTFLLILTASSKTCSEKLTFNLLRKSELLNSAQGEAYCWLKREYIPAFVCFFSSGCDQDPVAAYLTHGLLIPQCRKEKLYSPRQEGALQSYTLLELFNANNFCLAINKTNARSVD